MRMQKAWKVLTLISILGIACGCGSTPSSADPEAVAANTGPKHGVYVPQFEIVREIEQTDRWGEDITINQIATVTDELIYLVDNRTMRMLAVDREGNLVHAFLKKGQGPGEFQYFPRTQVLAGDLWLHEWQKMDRFSMDGKLLKEFRIQENYMNMIMLDESRFAGVVTATMGEEEDSQRIKQAAIWDLQENQLVKLAESDKLGTFEFQFGQNFITIMFSGGINPTLILAADPERKLIYTCVNDAYRIQVWDDQGNPVRTIERDIPPVTMTDAHKDEMAGDLRIGGLENGGEVKRALRKQLPDVYCRIAAIQVADTGHLIVERPVGYDQMELDVYAPDGTFLVTWQSPEDLKLDECLFHGGHFYRIDDESDLPKLVEYVLTDDVSRTILSN